MSITEVLNGVNAYRRKAQLYPALVVASPVVIAVMLLWPGLGLDKIFAGVVALGMPLFVMNLVRSRGQRLEQRLVTRWGGMPTTHLLRLNQPGNNPILLRRRRSALQRLTGEELPTAEEESDDPANADERYVAATRTLISRIREHADRYPRVHDELTDYGFWRNLLALKPAAVIVVVAALAADVLALWAGRDPQLVGTAATAHLILAVPTS